MSAAIRLVMTVRCEPAPLDARRSCVDVGMDERLAHAGQDHRLEPNRARRDRRGAPRPPRRRARCCFHARVAPIDEQRRVIPAGDAVGVAAVGDVDVDRLAGRARRGRRRCRRGRSAFTPPPALRAARRPRPRTQRGDPRVEILAACPQRLRGTAPARPPNASRAALARSLPSSLSSGPRAGQSANGASASSTVRAAPRRAPCGGPRAGTLHATPWSARNRRRGARGSPARRRPAARGLSSSAPHASIISMKCAPGRSRRRARPRAARRRPPPRRRRRRPRADTRRRSSAAVVARVVHAGTSARAEAARRARLGSRSARPRRGARPRSRRDLGAAPRRRTARLGARTSCSSATLSCGRNTAGTPACISSPYVL